MPIIRPTGNPIHHPKMKTHKIGDTRKRTLYVKKSEYFKVEDTDDFVFLEEGSQIEITEKFGYELPDKKAGLYWQRIDIDFSTLKTPEDIFRAELEVHKKINDMLVFGPRKAQVIEKDPQGVKPPITEEAPLEIRVSRWRCAWRWFYIKMGWRKPSIPIARIEKGGE